MEKVRNWNPPKGGGGGKGRRSQSDRKATAMGQRSSPGVPPIIVIFCRKSVVFTNRVYSGLHFLQVHKVYYL
jgi:hypothetical protein